MAIRQKLDIFSEFKKHTEIIANNKVKLTKLRKELIASENKQQKLLEELVKSKLILGKDLVLKNPEIVDYISKTKSWCPDCKDEYIISDCSYLYNPIKNIAYYIGKNPKMDIFSFDCKDTKIGFGFGNRKYLTPSYMYVDLSCYFSFELNLNNNTINNIVGKFNSTKLTKDQKRYDSIFGR